MGRFRFRSLSPNIDINSPQQVAQIAPPWALNLKIVDLEMPVRPYNVLFHEGLKIVAELCNYDDNRLRALPKMGRKSVIDLARAIQQCVLTSVPRTLRVSIDPNLLRQASPAQLETIFSDRVREPSNIDEAISIFLSSLKAEYSLIIQHRMGFHVERGTLQEIAEHLKMSRERVRQIEERIRRAERAKPYWQEAIEIPIARALSERDAPLPLVGLPVIDGWFNGIENLELPLEYVLENYGSNRFHLIRTEGCVFISMITQPEWEAALNSACILLENPASIGLKLSDAKLNVGALLVGSGEELRDELFFASSREAIFSLVNGDDEPVLAGYGRGAEVFVMAVLSESDRPLHYTEIAERIISTGKEIDVRRAHSAAINIGLLYGRGTYGLMRHFPFDEAETDELVAEAEDIIASGHPGRQWSCYELCELLGERGFDMDGRLTLYLVNIALKRSKSLTCLGRMVWNANSQTQSSNAERIEIGQAIESIIRQVGRPMSTREIREKLHEERSLNQLFQVNRNGNIIRISSKLWGLIDRDIPFTLDQQDAIVNVIEAVLAESQKGIHLTELPSVLNSRIEIDISNVDPKIIAALARRSNGIRLTYGGYLCLNGWDNSRRYSIADAIREVLEEAGPDGITAHEIREKAGILVGREIAPFNIYGPLSAVGAKFNNESGSWQLFEVENAEDF